MWCHLWLILSGDINVTHPVVTVLSQSGDSKILRSGDKMIRFTQPYHIRSLYRVQDAFPGMACSLHDTKARYYHRLENKEGGVRSCSQMVGLTEPFENWKEYFCKHSRYRGNKGSRLWHAKHKHPPQTRPHTSKHAICGVKSTVLWDITPS
jgi:hypothetical protein